MRRQLVTLEMRTQEPIGGGIAIADGFTAVAQIWAAIGASRGSIIQGDVQILDAVTHRMVLRWMDPTTWTHVRANGRRYRRREIIDPDGRERELQALLEDEGAVVDLPLGGLVLLDGAPLVFLDGAPVALLDAP